MPEAISAALGIPGLGWLLGAVIVAGLVRGFTGFGSAMIIMPVASSILSPVAAIVFLTMTDLVGPLPILPRAIKEGNRADALRLAIGVAIAMPVGVLSLSYLSPEMFGWMISVTVSVMLVLLISGWRYKGTLTPKLVTGAGALGGFLGGLTGVAGPPVIMLYMASSLPVKMIRANLILFLLTVDLAMLVTITLFGLIETVPVIIGLVLAVPYMLGNLVGAALFRPGSEHLFRKVAYVIIALSVLVGLPLWT